jgi:hypothetical protein
VENFSYLVFSLEFRLFASIKPVVSPQEEPVVVEEPVAKKGRASKRQATVRGELLVSWFSQLDLRP